MDSLSIDCVPIDLVALTSFLADVTSELASFPEGYFSLGARSVVDLRSENRNRPLPFAFGSLEFDRRFLLIGQIPLILRFEALSSKDTIFSCEGSKFEVGPV